MFAPGTLILDDSRSAPGGALVFADPLAVVAPEDASGLEALFALAERTRRENLHLAGMMTYELGYLFEERLAPLLPAGRRLPLAWFGLYRAPRALTASECDALFDAAPPGAAEAITLDTDYPAYERGLQAIKALIAAGDIYQANLTFRARFRLSGDATGLYADLRRKQPVAYGALLVTEAFSLLSRSPELFVEQKSGLLHARPMKGTARRGRTLAEDEAGRQALAADIKNRAENLMIVDLLRNDLGRIAEIGSVKVTDLFSVETFRTLHQMTSGITARGRPDAGFRQVIERLFPCGSITGAPKIRAMEVIRQVEPGPRGAYTGAIGYLRPDGDFCFNVAIRTATIFPDRSGEIGIGGGIVADSEPQSEYEEALLKLKFFTDPATPLALIETLLWERGTGYWLLDRHLARLADSAAYFGLDLGHPRAVLHRAAEGFEGDRMRVRLLLDEKAGLSVSATPLPPSDPEKPFRFILAEDRLDQDNPFLAHKTTNRGFYDGPRLAAQAEHGVDEVVFRNRLGELTEGSITSLFVDRGGVLLTPALGCGLLPGTLRAELIAEGRAREAVLTPADLETADALYLGNSVRGLLRAQWVRPDAEPRPDWI